jgi:hypothetical protein
MRTFPKRLSAESILRGSEEKRKRSLADFINVLDSCKPKETCKPFLYSWKQIFINGTRQQAPVSPSDDTADFQLGLHPVLLQFSGQHSCKLIDLCKI